MSYRSLVRKYYLSHLPTLRPLTHRALGNILVIPNLYNILWSPVLTLSEESGLSAHLPPSLSTLVQCPLHPPWITMLPESMAAPLNASCWNLGESMCPRFTMLRAICRHYYSTSLILKDMVQVEGWLVPLFQRSTWLGCVVYSGICQPY